MGGQSYKEHIVDFDSLTPSTERREPWTVKNSTDVSTAQTAGEALALAGLDWEVTQEPVYQKMPGDRKFRQVPNKRVNVRSTDGEVLGVVSPKYRVVQNIEALDFLTLLVESGEVVFDRAGSFENGKLVFMTLKIPNGMTVKGDVSDYETYLMVTTSHDGFRPTVASIEVIRQICTNGMIARSSLSSWKVRHTSSLSGKQAIARESLGITFDYNDRLQSALQLLADTEVHIDDVDEVLRLIFPVSDNASEAQIERSQFAGAREMYDVSETVDGTRGTMLGVYNAVTEFVDHASTYRSKAMPIDEARAESILFGPASWKKARALQQISMFAGLDIRV